MVPINAAWLCLLLRWLEVGDRLNLQPVQAKAMAFLKATIEAGCTKALCHRDILEKLPLSHKTHVEILMIFMGALGKCPRCGPVGPHPSAFLKRSIAVLCHRCNACYLTH